MFDLPCQVHLLLLLPLSEEVENLMIQSFGEVPSNLAGVVIMILEGKAIVVLGLLDWLKE